MTTVSEVSLIHKKVLPLHLGSIVPLFDTCKNYRELKWESDGYQLQINRQIKNLRAFVRIGSVSPIIIPSPGDFTDDFQFRMKINSLLWESERKHLDLFFSQGIGEWIQRGTASLVNRDDTPYYDLDLMGFFTESDTIDLGENNKIGVSVADIGNGFLGTGDSVQIYGTIIKTVTLISI